MRIEVVCVCVWRGKGWEGGKDSKARMEAGAVRVRKWSLDRTTNDPGPEMIPDGDRKWSRPKNKE